MYKDMKKVLAVILMALMGVTSVSADNFIDDEHPGGWDFELPLLKVKKTNTTREVKFSLSSSFSFGFIGGVGQAKDVDIDMGQSFELEWGDVVSLETRIGKAQSPSSAASTPSAFLCPSSIIIVWANT